MLSGMDGRQSGIWISPRGESSVRSSSRELCQASCRNEGREGSLFVTMMAQLQ